MAIAAGVSATANFGSAGSSANSTVTAGIATQSSGSLLVVGVVWQTDSTRPTITDSKGNTWSTFGAVQQAAADPSYIGLWYCENATGGSSHTFTASKTNGFASVFASEWTGIATSSSTDQTTGLPSDTSSPVTSGVTGTTAQADELLIGLTGCACTATTVFTPNNSFTSLLEQNSNTVWQGIMSYRIVSATGTYETSNGVTNLTSGAALIGTFKGASTTPQNMTFLWRA